MARKLEEQISFWSFSLLTLFFSEGDLLCTFGRSSMEETKLSVDTLDAITKVMPKITEAPKTDRHRERVFLWCAIDLAKYTRLRIKITGGNVEAYLILSSV